jgi:hypothetical protein
MARLKIQCLLYSYVLYQQTEHSTDPTFCPEHICIIFILRAVFTTNNDYFPRTCSKNRTGVKFIVFKDFMRTPRHLSRATTVQSVEWPTYGLDVIVIFLFSETSRSAVQRAPGPLTPVVKMTWRKVDHTPHLLPRLKMSGAIHPRLHSLSQRVRCTGSLPSPWQPIVPGKLGT